MSTTLARALTGIVLLAAVVTGCADQGSSASDGERDRVSSSAGTPGSTSSARPAAGAVGSQECGLDRDQLSLVVRDWGRVYGSIGRGDHPTYTGAFVTRLAATRQDAAGCDGSIALGRFEEAVRRIDEASRRPTPDYALYDAAITQGNTWLADVGYGTNALTVD